jgi:hypothetical protein
MDYTITLTEAENKAMEYIATDVNDWITNAVINRARIAIDEIVALEVERITSQGGELSGTKEDIVLAAPIKSARERQEEFDSQNPLTPPA